MSGPPPPRPLPAAFELWITALEERHLANLRVPEVTRALRALSSAYVHRRHTLQAGAPLDSAGKRAAFALFYGPLHFLTVWRVLEALRAAPPGDSLLDLGCGTGAAGAAWAMSGNGVRPAVLGIDRHPWAAAEARWTYHHFALRGRARVGDAVRLPHIDARSGIVVAYVLNELSEDVRMPLLERLARAARGGTRVLILEPVARNVAPWWERAKAALDEGANVRADEWRFRVELPPFVKLLDRAAGLDHHELTVRTLSCNLA